MARFLLVLAALASVEGGAGPPTARAAPTTASAPRAGSRADRLDALDFDNGAILVSETGSYGSGIGAWSAWHLTDGDEEVGWCSPQGSPVGATFVWDLDTAWDLRARTSSAATTGPTAPRSGAR
jgi:hypothetical protein